MDFVIVFQTSQQSFSFDLFLIYQNSFFFFKQHFRSKNRVIIIFPFFYLLTCKLQSKSSRLALTLLLKSLFSIFTTCIPNFSPGLLQQIFSFYLYLLSFQTPIDSMQTARMFFLASLQLFSLKSTRGLLSLPNETHIFQLDFPELS